MLAGVVGRLPFELGNVTELRVLSIQNSDLSAGPVPESIKMYSISYNFGSANCSNNFQWDYERSRHLVFAIGANNLDSLTLHANEFIGSIPSWLCELVQLTILQLSYNQLNGQIPDCKGSLSLMKIIELSYNDLTGELPIEICDLVKLQELTIHDTLIEGNIKASSFNA
jgi:hypothetical protein